MITSTEEKKRTLEKKKNLILDSSFHNTNVPESIYICSSKVYFQNLILENLF